MQNDRIHFAPPVDGFAALGAESGDDLLCPDRLATWSRAEILPSRAGDLVARVPLPGTRGPEGRVYERPRGAGTGFVILRRYRTSFGTGLRARLSHPRSLSLAEREWNLSCLLREAGVGTPDLMCALARGAGMFAKASVLIVRELSGLLRLDQWGNAEDLSDEDRDLGLEAISGCLERLERSRIVLPELEMRDIFVTMPSGCEKSAAALKACGVGSPGAEPPGPLRRLPGVVLANLRGGVQVSRANDPRAQRQLQRLRTEIESATKAKTH